MENKQFSQLSLYGPRSKVAIGLMVILCLQLTAITVPAYAGNPTLSITDVTVKEDSGTNAVFTVNLSAASTKVVTVNYSTSNGSATSPNDYTSASGTLTIPANVTSKTVIVSVVVDPVIERNETFYVNLSNPVNASIRDAQGVGTITNDDYYYVNVLGNGSAQAMNDSGIIVGWSLVNGGPNATMYYLGGGGEININIGATWVDLDDNSATTDWTAIYAYGINNNLETVGIATNNLTGATRAFHFDLLSRVFKLLPGPIYYDSNYFGPSINDNAIICTTNAGYAVVYTPDGLSSYVRETLPTSANYVRINNAGVIAGWSNGNGSGRFAFRAFPNLGYPNAPYANAQIDTFLDYDFRGISDGVGTIPAQICGRKNNGFPKGTVPVRLNAYDPTPNIQLLSSSTNEIPWDVNDSGDVLLFGGDGLYKDGVKLNINDLIAPADKLTWDAYPSRLYRSISNRNSTTGSGLIGLGASSKAILLTPYKP